MYSQPGPPISDLDDTDFHIHDGTRARAERSRLYFHGFFCPRGVVGIDVFVHDLDKLGYDVIAL